MKCKYCGAKQTEGGHWSEGDCLWSFIDDDLCEPCWHLRRTLLDSLKHEHRINTTMLTWMLFDARESLERSRLLECETNERFLAELKAEIRAEVEAEIKRNVQ